MQRILLSLLTYCCLSGLAFGQDLPVVSQKMTNAFLYNPSLAGLDGGFAVFTHQRQWNDLNDNPTFNYASVQSPLFGGKLGVGLNFFQDQLGLIKQTNISGGGSYHFLVDYGTVISLGVMAEYVEFNIDYSKVNVRDADDPIINKYAGLTNFDFSGGINITFYHLDVGFAVNRLANFVGTQPEQAELNSFYEAHLMYRAEVARNVWLEPRVNYRKPKTAEAVADFGLFFDYHHYFSLGASYRTNSLLNFSSSLGIGKNVTLGYAYELPMDGQLREFGSNNEISLRVNFRQKEHIVEQTKDLHNRKAGLTYGRKSISRGKRKGKLKPKLKRNKRKRLKPKMKRN